MSKSYGNDVSAAKEPKVLDGEDRKMMTDPRAGTATDPGEPERCPVWQLHLVYSNQSTRSGPEGLPHAASAASSASSR